MTNVGPDIIKVLEEKIGSTSLMGFPGSSTVKNPPVMQETQVQSPGWEDTLEESMATHSGILAWRIPMGSGAWWATVHGVAKSGSRLSD